MKKKSGPTEVTHPKLNFQKARERGSKSIAYAQ